MYILYMQILKVIIKLKQNLKWEKEFNIAAEVKTMLFMREGSDWRSCARLFTCKDHTDPWRALLSLVTCQSLWRSQGIIYPSHASSVNRMW